MSQIDLILIFTLSRFRLNQFFTSLDIILVEKAIPVPQDCGPWAVLEARGQDFSQYPKDWGGILA